MDKLQSEAEGLGNLSWEFTYADSAHSAEESVAIFIDQVRGAHISAVWTGMPRAAEVENVVC